MCLCGGGVVCVAERGGGGEVWRGEGRRGPTRWLQGGTFLAEEEWWWSWF